VASDDEPSPPAPPTPPTVGGLDRKTVERVLARATQLNASAMGEPTDLITHDQLFEIAKEVGLAPSAITQALAEERTRVDVDVASDSGWLNQITGPTVVSAQRVVTGDAMRAMAVLDRWMQDGEYLQVQRQFPDRMVWEPRTDWAAIMLKAWRAGGRSYHLREARGVAATIVPIDDERVLVRLDADITPARNRRIGLGIGVGAFGLVVGAAVGALGALFQITELGILGMSAVPVAAAGVGSHAILRSHRATAERVKLGLEQAIDKLDYGTPPQRGALDSLVTRPQLR